MEPSNPWRALLKYGHTNSPGSTIMIALLLAACQVTIPFSSDEEDTGAASGDTGVLDTSADDSDTSDTGGGSLATEWALAAGHESRWVWAQDVTGDGLEDIVYASTSSSSWDERGRPFELNLIVNEGGGRFAEPRTYPLGHNENYYIDAAFADLNEDGIGDVVMGHMDGFSVFFGSESGVLDGPHDTDDVESLSLALGDVDGDGHVDAAVCSPAGQFVVWQGDGTGRLARGGGSATCGRWEPSVEPPRSALVDLDANGSPDFLRRIAFGAALEIVWNERGTFGDATVYQPSPSVITADHPMQDFAVLRLPQFDTPVVAVAAFAEPTQWMFAFPDRKMDAAAGWGMLSSTYTVQLIVDDADGDGLDDLITPYRLLDDRAEAAVWLTSDLGGGLYHQEYFPGEWEMTGVYNEATDHGFDLLDADREGLSPLVVTTVDGTGRNSIRIVEAEAAL